MDRPARHPLDAYLDRVADVTRGLQQLNLRVEGGRHQALAESQHLLAVLAMFRHQLKHLEAEEVDW